MHKLPFALAALAAAGAVQAQSSVTLAGIVKGGLTSTRYAGGAAGNGSATSIADGSSRFLLIGREDLGGGLAAQFQVDTRFRVDDNGAAPTSSPLATGNSFVGLAGGFGQVRLGKLDTHYCLGMDEHNVRATALQASSCGVLGFVNGSTGARAVANASRSMNILRYDVPASLVRGLTGGVAYSPNPFGNDGNVGTAGKGRAWSANVGYALAPWSVGASFWDAQSEDRNLAVARQDQRAWTLAGSWNFGIGRVGLVFDRSELSSAAAGAAAFVPTRRDAWSVPVTVAAGPGTVLLTYTRAQDVETGGTSVAGTGARLLSVGYDWPLSRRTSIGVSYASLDNGAAAAYGFFTAQGSTNLPTPVAGQDQRQFYVGVRHAF